MTCVMRIPAFLFCAAITASTAHSAPLTSADREALLEKLESLENDANATVDARYRLAVSAFREAMTSDEKAIEFYLKCIEKVEYTDLKRKSQDFRNWKKKEDDNLGRPGFRRALRHQLRWLSLTLEADSSAADVKLLTEKAKVIVRDVFDDLKMMEDQEQVLTQSVISTVFAKAYSIEGVDAKSWSLSPLNLDGLYENIFLPPCRNRERLGDLRATWLKRIEQELAIRDNMARYARRLQKEKEWHEQLYQTRNSPNESNNDYAETKIGTVDAMHSPEYKQFMADELPGLVWKMEVDLYRCGDESGASVRMLDHLKKHITHRSAREWSDELKKLLSAETTAVKPEAVPPQS